MDHQVAEFVSYKLILVNDEDCLDGVPCHGDGPGDKWGLRGKCLDCGQKCIPPKKCVNARAPSWIRNYEMACKIPIGSKGCLKNTDCEMNALCLNGKCMELGKCIKTSDCNIQGADQTIIAKEGQCYKGWCRSIKNQTCIVENMEYGPPSNLIWPCITRCGSNGKCL